MLEKLNRIEYQNFDYHKILSVKTKEKCPYCKTKLEKETNYRFWCNKCQNSFVKEGNILIHD